MNEGIKLIFSIWGNKEGWVFLPVKDFRNNKWKEVSFYWPVQRNKIKKHIEKTIKEKNSIYWCPTVFTKRNRIKENVEPKLNILWADLDEVHPSECIHKPTIAWESSPKRYQCLWLLNKPIPAEKAEKINQRMTYTVGADKGGWDLTQVLRIPGLPNYKHKGGPKGRLLWDDGKVYNPKDIKRGLKSYEEIYPSKSSDESTEADINEILKNYYKRLPKRVYELFFTPEHDVSVGERSDRLWELECLLAEAGVKTKDIIKLVKMSPWNKFEGRRNEDEQIKAEVYKAKEKVKLLGSERAIISLGNDRVVTWTNYETIMGQTHQKPKWLIEGIWQDKSHGIVAGEPKTYKSVTTTEIAVSVASGKPMFGKFEVHNQGPVLIIQEENHPYLIQDRLKKMVNAKGLLDGEATVENNILTVRFPSSIPIHFLNQYGFNLSDEDDRKFIERSIKKYKPVLVIFDPLYLMLGGIDENNSKDLRPILNWLIQLRYNYNTGIMLVHHWNKGGQSSRGGQRMLGSTTFHAWVESALYCSVRNEIEHEINIEREFRSFPKPKNLKVKYKMGEPGSLDYSPEVSDSTMSKEDIIEAIRSSNGMTEKELLTFTGIPRSTLKGMLDLAVKQGLLIKTGGGVGRGKSSFYSINDKGVEIVNA